MRPHTPPSRRTARIALFAALAVAVVACSGPERRQEGPPAPRPPRGADSAMAEVARQCLALLEEYGQASFETASEAELQRQMEEAALNQELCGRALLQAYDGPGGRVMAAHLARGLELHALKAELTLSERFDDLGGYCPILEDIIALLHRDVTEAAEELQAAIDGRRRLEQADFQTLVSLRDLSVQTLQVSLVDYRTTCE
jgi:hypothetical protein